jgi:hypothetical protein
VGCNLMNHIGKRALLGIPAEGRLDSHLESGPPKKTPKIRSALSIRDSICTASSKGRNCASDHVAATSPPATDAWSQGCEEPVGSSAGLVNSYLFLNSRLQTFRNETHAWGAAAAAAAQWPVLPLSERCTGTGPSIPGKRNRTTGRRSHYGVAISVSRLCMKPERLATTMNASTARTVTRPIDSVGSTTTDAYRCLSGYDFPYAVPHNTVSTKPVPHSLLVTITITPTPPALEPWWLARFPECHPSQVALATDNVNKGKGAEEAVRKETF